MEEADARVQDRHLRIFNICPLIAQQNATSFQHSVSNDLGLQDLAIDKPLEVIRGNIMCRVLDDLTAYR